MAKAETRQFQKPDETRTFPCGKLELVKIAGGTIGRFTLEPGWKWSQHVKPVAKTDLCEAPHFGYQFSGRMAVQMSDGTKFETGPGEAMSIPPGHDAWVVGEDPVVLIDWTGATNYAKK